MNTIHGDPIRVSLSARGGKVLVVAMYNAAAEGNIIWPIKKGQAAIVTAATNYDFGSGSEYDIIFDPLHGWRNQSPTTEIAIA